MIRGFSLNHLKSINTNQFRKQVIELLRYPPVNKNVVISLLADLRDSQNNILGKIVHQDQLKKTTFDNHFENIKLC